ncbi:MAG: radical SAM protein [Anaerolineae bacterium]|nr:radical SAM protein [Anaerolineae bacterium]
MVDAYQKLRILAPAAAIEPAEDVDLVGRRMPLRHTAGSLKDCISHATLPGGKKVPILKTLVSSVCENDCNYCAFRAGRDIRRETFIPDELAYLSQQIYQQKLIKGVFLSSGLIGGGPRTQDKLIETAEILRRKYQFTGYLHLKIMPDAEKDQIRAAMQWADRLSVNLEAPNAQRLASLAPKKAFSQGLMQRLKWIDELRQEMIGRKPSICTQFVVGAVGETDVELLLTSSYLYNDLHLARTYFSGFNPIDDTPLEHHPPIVLKREQRLYQASSLLRDYDFDVEELPFTKQGNLPLDQDPKMVWAGENLREKPMEINTAERKMLIRVPGIGVKSAERILQQRKMGTISELSHLKRMGIPTKRAAPFILLDGRSMPRQLTLWAVS